ncbi:protein MAINTENANCE OF MERISTEMS-like [Arachis ipaensis]|uniref:protein MAINTENANCE OF MERISTEMS-like n=1 Tax=Arachis ipaensis TaxID=130454 RepID=UPI000A2B83A7|nr:protein MAINTENANCE OF MERISTEMS-like [Arachis ipaensis]
MGSYSWGAAALAWLYRCMCRVTNRNVTNLAGPLQLLQSWIFWRFSTLRPSGFDAFSFPLASRWATYLPSSDGKERRIIQYRLALDRLTHRDVSILFLFVVILIVFFTLICIHWYNADLASCLSDCVGALWFAGRTGSHPSGDTDRGAQPVMAGCHQHDLLCSY